jgi:hypothetical protein
MFFGLMQEASPPCLLGAFPLFLTFFFFFPSIVYMHLSLGQEAQPPCLLGGFSFVC